MTRTTDYISEYRCNIDGILVFKCAAHRSSGPDDRRRRRRRVSTGSRRTPPASTPWTFPSSRLPTPPSASTAFHLSFIIVVGQSLSQRDPVVVVVIVVVKVTTLHPSCMPFAVSRTSKDLRHVDGVIHRSTRHAHASNVCQHRRRARRNHRRLLSPVARSSSSVARPIDHEGLDTHPCDARG